MKGNDSHMSQQKHYLTDYQPSNFFISHVDLLVQLHPTATRVVAQLSLVANHEDVQQTLSLVGEDLKLLSLAINDQLCSPADYQLSETGLEVVIVGQEAVLRIETEINPQANTRLEGLYLSDGVFCTQCEAEGFRRITYFLDRPDVMALYRTRIEGDQQLAPVLLSNGNLVESGQLDNQRHYAVWEDPFPKPSYLFAVVAGDLVCQQQNYQTADGRQVSLEVYVKQHHAARCQHALYSLASAMRWDEQTFGLNYDLDRYMIVAVDDFNMGAMENKGLNVFNARFVLADPQTATDADYINIDSVIAHEYFHNWTGNRVTCRDWFQLTLKEGLTVYRDQLYTEQTLLGKVQRIDDVRTLRNFQFAEDASGLRHPIQPAAYVEMNNFYTSTVYEKGAEVVRIYATLLGAAGFRKGMDLYFQRHDGQAVTVHEFRNAMADANQIDLSQMHNWYTQAGTPVVKVVHHWQAETATLSVTLSQHIANAQHFKPLLIPFSMAVFNTQGQGQTVELKQGKGVWQGHEGVLWLTQAEETFVFAQVMQAPKLSLLRNFSAPVILQTNLTADDWLWQAAHDDDLFNRWEAWQQVWTLYILAIQQAMQTGQSVEMPANLLPAIQAMLINTDLPADWLAEALRLPSFDYLAQQVEQFDPVTLTEAIKQFKRWLAQSLAQDIWLQLAPRLAQVQQFAYEAQVLAQRRLVHVLLHYLAEIGDERVFAWAETQVNLVTDMTHSQTALALLVHYQAPQAQAALDAFYQRWHGVNLVLDKWFSCQAANPTATLAEMQQLSQHEQFVRTNPNRVRSLIATFGRLNPTLFHAADGSGYRWLAEQVLQIDGINPQISSRLVQAFNTWQKLVDGQKQLAKDALTALAAQSGLSKDLREVLENLGYAH